MGWQKNVSEGLYRISLTLSIFFGIITFLLFFREGIIFAIITSIIVSVIIFVLIAVLNWIVRGFIG